MSSQEILTPSKIDVGPIVGTGTISFREVGGHVETGTEKLKQAHRGHLQSVLPCSRLCFNEAIGSLKVHGN